jgi:hypothetical protein
MHKIKIRIALSFFILPSLLAASRLATHAGTVREYYCADTVTIGQAVPQSRDEPLRIGRN